MSDIPKEAIDVLATALMQFANEANDPDVYREPAKAMLREVEEAWPHNPPQRDPASTTYATTERAWAPSIGFTGRLRRDPLHVTS